HPADPHGRDIAYASVVRIYTFRVSMQAGPRVTERPREGVVVGLSIWWKKLSPDGRNANQVTSQALTDLGGSATFYDCLVEVEPMH
ncbi:molybdopterin dinucleotide binding domain-containing protein, partial [Caballeronia sp. ATUFL_F2_KS9A]|uniref:molybdopterin dinucleotide binding domain-containing protein n=1 Tax=Caballeronia sp. ATUFL_F2_KS9A TaxID=2921777 RepID=UPI0025412369